MGRMIKRVHNGKLVGDWPGRKFELWFYTPSHSCLLFRSNKSKTHPTRIDLLFGGVDALECRANLDSLKIVEVPVASLQDLDTFVTTQPHKNFKGYILTATDSKGYIVARGVEIAEDDKEWNEPSSINV